MPKHYLSRRYLSTVEWSTLRRTTMMDTAIYVLLRNRQFRK
jgi:hypothetical protein